MNPVQTKSDLLIQCQTLDYDQRVGLASRFGNQHRADASLAAVIAELQDHPAPMLVEVAASNTDEDDEFSQILPPQTKNVAKYYDEDRLALALASAAGKADVLKAEVLSPSLMFKQLAVTEVVRLEKSDDVLFDLAVKAVLNVRTKLIRALVRFNRTAVLDRLVTPLLESHGPDYVANFIHACSPAVASSTIQLNPLVYDSENLDINKLAKYHGTILLDKLQHRLRQLLDIDEKHFAIHKRVQCSVHQGWNEWVTRLSGSSKKLGTRKAVGVMLHEASDSKQLARRLLNLARQYFIFDCKDHLFRQRPLLDDDKVLAYYNITLPLPITGEMAFFVRYFPDDMVFWAKKLMHADHKGAAPASYQWDNSIPQASTASKGVVLEVVEHYLTTILRANHPTDMARLQSVRDVVTMAAHLPATTRSLPIRLALIEMFTKHLAPQRCEYNWALVDLWQSALMVTIDTWRDGYAKRVEHAGVRAKAAAKAASNGLETKERTKPGFRVPTVEEDAKAADVQLGRVRTALAAYREAVAYDLYTCITQPANIISSGHFKHLDSYFAKDYYVPPKAKWTRAERIAELKSAFEDDIFEQLRRTPLLQELWNEVMQPKLEKVLANELAALTEWDTQPRADRTSTPPGVPHLYNNETEKSISFLNTLLQPFDIKPPKVQPRI